MNNPVRKIPKTGYTKYNQLTPVESKFSVRNSLIHSTRNFRNHAANAVKIPARKLNIRIKCFSFIFFSRHKIKRCNQLFLFSSIKLQLFFNIYIFSSCSIASDCVHSFFYSLIIFTSPPLPSLIMLDGLGCPTSSCLYSTI